MYLLGVSVICDVTPFLGVWIEIYETSIIPDAVWVTPFLGVWIEMIPSAPLCDVSIRHSLLGSVD